MSQAQSRAKRGAALAESEGEKVGAFEDFSTGVKTRATTAGTKDKICDCEPAGTVAATGDCGTEAGRAAQQGILPPQPQ